jgi:hypothetical protein
MGAMVQICTAVETPGQKKGYQEAPLLCFYERNTVESPRTCVVVSLPEATLRNELIETRHMY